MVNPKSSRSYQFQKQVEPKKYIKIPAYAPLYAMRKCHGPTTGPIKTPIPVPISIIGELLTQRTSTPRIYEVVPIDPVHKIYSEPVELTLANYKLPYNEISPTPVYFDENGKVVKEPTVELVTPATTETIPEKKDEEVVEIAPVETAEEVKEPVIEEPVVEVSEETATETESVETSDESVSEEVAEEEETQEAETTEIPVETYKLSKSERRRLAREKRAQEAQANTTETDSND